MEIVKQFCKIVHGNNVFGKTIMFFWMVQMYGHI